MNSLLKLGEDIICYIFQYLNIYDYIYFIVTCKYINTLFKSDKCFTLLSYENKKKLFINSCINSCINTNLGEKLYINRINTEIINEILKETKNVEIKLFINKNYTKYINSDNLVSINIILKNIKIIFKDAINEGNDKLVKFLIIYKYVSPNMDDDYAITYASAFGHINIVEFLLTKTYTSVNPFICSGAFYKTIRNKNLSIALMLINHCIKYKYIYLKSEENLRNVQLSIIEAIINNLDNIVLKALAYDIIDPSFDNNALLLYACLYNNNYLIKLLLENSRVNPACNEYYILFRLIEQNECLSLKKLINDKRVNIFEILPRLVRYADKLFRYDIINMLKSNKKVNSCINYWSNQYRYNINY